MKFTGVDLNVRPVLVCGSLNLGAEFSPKIIHRYHDRPPSSVLPNSSTHFAVDEPGPAPQLFGDDEGVIAYDGADLRPSPDGVINPAIIAALGIEIDLAFLAATLPRSPSFDHDFLEPIEITSAVGNGAVKVKPLLLGDVCREPIEGDRAKPTFGRPVEGEAYGPNEALGMGKESGLCLGRDIEGEGHGFAPRL